MPLSRVCLGIAEPIVGAEALFDSFFELSDVSITVGLQFVAKSTKIAIMVISLEYVAVTEEWDWESVEGVEFFFLLSGYVSGFVFAAKLWDEVYAFFIFD